MCPRAAYLRGNYYYKQAFLCCHVFPAVSELDYLLLEHVVFSGDLDFVFGKCYTREALNRFLGVLILIGTRAVLITRFPLALIFSCAGFSTFAYLGFFFSWYSRAKCQILGGGVEYDMI